MNNKYITAWLVIITILNVVLFTARFTLFNPKSTDTEQIQTPVPTPEISSKEVMLIEPITDEDLITRQLYLLATWKLKDLVDTNYWAHTSSNGDTFAHRTKVVGLQQTGEILYRGPCDYKLAITSWENSQSHNDILMDTSFTHMVSVMGKNDKFCYIVQEYAK